MVCYGCIFSRSYWLTIIHCHHFSVVNAAPTVGCPVLPQVLLPLGFGALYNHSAEPNVSGSNWKILEAVVTQWSLK